MPASPTFEKTNLPWQLRQFQQQIGEWIEQKLSEIKLPKLNLPKGPNVAFDPEWLRIGFWLGIAGLVAWLGWRLWPTVWPWLQQAWQRTAERPAAAADPAPWRRQSASSWVQAAEAFGRQANYGEACRALYFAMLQRFNDTQLVPYADSRTDGEYWISLMSALPQTSHRAAQTQSCQVLLQTHEQVCFGPGTVTAATFDRCTKAYRTFDDGARSAAQSAAPASPSEAKP
jgi:Domain of unknown function (DUF4129)